MTLLSHSSYLPAIAWRWICLASFALLLASHAQAQSEPPTMPGFFHEFSALQDRGRTSDAPNEVIDPFSGTLNIVHSDIVVPGNGGLDIVVNRIYSSNNVYRFGLTAFMPEATLGNAWEMHMGRVRGSGNSVNLCTQTPGDTAQNPVIELGSGEQKQLFRNDYNLTNAKYVTRDQWVAYCTDSGDETGLLVIDPNGTRYNFSLRRVTRGRLHSGLAYIWYVTRIEDRNGNWITVDYDDGADADDGVMLDRIEANDGRVVTFGHFRGRINTASNGNRQWRYNYDSNDNLTRVDRPVGSWRYTYQTSGYRLLKSMTYPEGGVVNYTFERVCLAPTLCLSGADLEPFSVGFSLAVSRKTQSGPAIDAGTWDYSYRKNGDYLTTEVDFEEGKTEYNHYRWATDGYWQVGLLESKKRYRGNTLVETETFDYVQGTKISSQLNRRQPFSLSTNGVFAPRLVKHTINRDSTNYVTDYSNFDSNNNPRRIRETGQATKTTNVTYYPRRDNQNIVSLVEDERFGSGSAERVERTFDSRGNLTREIAYGVRTDYRYDSRGNLTESTNANGRTTRYSSYYRGIARSESQPEGVSISRVVNAFGQITRENDGRGQNTSFTYDGLGRLTRINYPFGTSTSISWGTRRATVSRGGFRATIDYDGFDREVCTTYEGIAVSKRYNSIGTHIFQSLPSSSCTTNNGQSFSDILGRLTQIRFEDGTTKSYTYLSNNRVRVNDERGKNYTFRYRSFGNPSDTVLMGVTGPQALDWEITRNTLGQPTTIKRNSTVRTYAYNGATFLIRATHPETGTTTYGRDAVGNMTSETTGGSTISYRYDHRNRRTFTNYPGNAPDVTYTYDKNDNLTRLQSGLTDFRYTYDNNDNLVREQQTIDSRNYFIEYRYNGLDNLESITYPDGGVTQFSPNDLGWPGQATPFVTDANYNRYGQPTSLLYANERRATLSYNNRNWPTRIRVDNGVIDRDYSYDSGGNTTSLVDQLNATLNRAMSYDDLNRLTSANGPWGSGAVNYSNDDDITTKNVGLRRLTYSYSGNKVSQVSGLQNFITPAQVGHDGRGNMNQLSNGNYGWTYQYDAASNLRVVNQVGGGQLQAHDYDGNRMRVRSVTADETRVYIYTQKGQLLNEFVTSGTGSNLAYAYLGSQLVAEAETRNGPVTPATVYGYGYGNSQNRVSYSTVFTLQEMPEYVRICANGYGINTNREVRIAVNGVVLGYLLPGGDDTPRQTCLEVQPSRLVVGRNTLTFTQANPGQTWGVGVPAIVPIKTSLVPIGALMLLLND